MILTARLIVKPWALADTEAFYHLSQDDGFNLFPIKIYRQDSLASAQAWIQDSIELHQKTSMGRLAVWEKSTGELIGLGGLTPWKHDDEALVDITYRLRQSAWGKGLGTELARGLVQFGFEELQLEQITATITPDNFASKKIASALGMIFDQNIVLLQKSTDLYRLKRPN